MRNVSGAALLKRVRPLTHVARVRAMVDLGRAARTDTAMAALLSSCARGSFEERWLALYACFGSRDGAYVLHALSDSSRAVRSLALSLVPHACDDAQAEEALMFASGPDATHLAASLRLKKRHGPIDAAATRLVEAGDKAALALIPYASPATVERSISFVEDAVPLTFWGRLAHAHPALTVAALITQASGAGRDDPAPWSRVVAATPILAEIDPDRALLLLRAVSTFIAPERLPLAQLLRRRPAATVDLALQWDIVSTLDIGPVAHRLDAERLIALLEREPLVHAAVLTHLPSLPPAVRQTLFARFGAGQKDESGIIAFSVVAALPSEQRLPEARRHLALPALAADPNERLPYAGLLPWEEARRILDADIGSPDPNLRAVAMAALVMTVRYERRHAVDLLIFARTRRNEQDPVRLSLVAGLAALPATTWEVSSLEALGSVVADALGAADLSPATVAAIGRLVAKLFPYHPQWSAQQLATLARDRGMLPLSDLEDVLTDADAARIAPLVLPILASWEAREREGYVLTLAQNLGRRLRLDAFAPLHAMLGRIAASTRNTGTADRALSLLRRWRADDFAALVPRLLRNDESVATLSVVWRWLQHTRQDLLTPYLGQRAYAGRFATGKTRPVLPFDGVFAFWNAEQRRLFASSLHDLTNLDPTPRDTPTILNAVKRLGRLQDGDITLLIALTERENRAVRDTAVRALGILDDGTVAATALLAMMDDDRARIAVYALRRILLRMPDDRAVALLGALPLDRVTVAKEVVRLYGDLRGEASFNALKAIGARRLHRDVRVAWLRALWGHLDKDGSWDLLDDAARDPDEALARSLVRIPADGLPVLGRARLASLLGLLLDHSAPLVRIAALERCTDSFVADPQRRLFVKTATKLTSPLPAERRVASSALFALSDDRDADAVRSIFMTLLPHRRALSDGLWGLQAALYRRRGSLSSVAVAVLDALATDKLTATLQVQLAIRALPWAEAGALLQRLAGEGALHSDALAAASVLLEGRMQARPSGGLDALERRFAVDDDRYLRRLGLAALSGLAAVFSWTPELRARLAIYQADASAIVASAAQFTFPSEETVAE